MSSGMANHPESGQILRLLDGELSAADARNLQRHLESCWHCRRERNEIEGAIDAFVRYRESIWVPRVPPPPRSWPDFQLRCAELDLAAPSPASRNWTFWRAIAAGAFGLALVAATVMLRERPIQLKPLPNPPAPVPSVVHPPASVPPARPSIPTAPPALPSRPSLLSVEVAVIQTLHRAEADLGEPIAIVAVGNTVLVKATALEPARAEALRAAIEAIPGAHFAIHEPPTVAAEATPGSTVTPRPLLFAARLRSHFGSESARDDFANSVIDLSDAITARAHAWNKLQERFSSLDLPEKEAEIIRSIQATHRGILRRKATELRNLLASVFPEPSLEPGPSRPLAISAREFDELVSASFAGATSDLTDSELLARLQAVLKELAQ